MSGAGVGTPAATLDCVTSMRVTVLLFARLREQAGRRSIDVALEEGATATAAWTAVARMCPRLGDPTSPPGDLRVAVDECYAAWDTVLREGATVALIPPVAGGAGPERVSVRITEEALDARECERLVRSDGDGAVCTFTGVVRDRNDGRAVTGIDYEAYRSMAEAEMRRVADEVVAGEGVSAVAMVHRVGTLGIGEASVVVSVSAPHRHEAFTACHRAIDLLKQRVPIWKHEHGPDGSLWSGDARTPAP